jgi:SAM-dependent methyltransferase
MCRLEERHFANLTFSEVSRALRALSATYVERRGRIAEGAALAGAGKRAAFALFYGPLHFLLIREIVHALPGTRDGMVTLADLGCGSGTSGAAWATSCPRAPKVVGIDRHPWALGEAAETYRAFGLPARTHRDDMATALLPKPPAAFLAAFSLNEMSEAGRNSILERLVKRRRGGERLLVVEPLAGFVAPWWNGWRDAVVRGGGREDAWRFRVELPAIVAKLDRAAGLDHRELSGRSLWLA